MLPFFASGVTQTVWRVWSGGGIVAWSGVLTGLRKGSLPTRSIWMSGRNVLMVYVFCEM
jgi:hypothetical protein